MLHIHQFWVCSHVDEAVQKKTGEFLRVESPQLDEIPGASAMPGPLPIPCQSTLSWNGRGHTVWEAQSAMTPFWGPDFEDTTIGKSFVHICSITRTLPSQPLLMEVELPLPVEKRCHVDLATGMVRLSGMHSRRAGWGTGHAEVICFLHDRCLNLASTDSRFVPQRTTDPYIYIAV